MHTDMARLKKCVVLSCFIPISDWKPHLYQLFPSVLCTHLGKQSVGILTCVFSFASWGIVSKAKGVIHLANTDQMPGNNFPVGKCLTTTEMYRNTHRLFWSRNYTLRCTLTFWLGAKILRRGLVKSVSVWYCRCSSLWFVAGMIYTLDVAMSIIVNTQENLIQFTGFPNQI